MKHVSSIFLVAVFSLIGILSNAQVFFSSTLDNGIPQEWQTYEVSYTNSIWYGCSGGAASIYNNQGYIITPMFQSTGGNIVLSFDYKLGGGILINGDFGELRVEHSVDGGGVWIADTIINQSNHTPSLDCANVSLVISSSEVGVGDNVMFRWFNVRNPGYYYQTGIDNIEISEDWSCPFPLNLQVLGESTSFVELAWAAQGSETEWIVEYGPEGFTPGSGTSQIVTNDTVTISGIPSDQFYDANVRAICGSGDTSVIFESVKFNTSTVPKYSGYDLNCSPIGFYDIVGAPSVFLEDDEETNLAMPFPFVFQGNMVTELRVGSNGGILFNNPTGNISTGGNLNNLNTQVGAYPFWDDLEGDQSPIYFETVGTAPNRVLIVQWHNRGHYNEIQGSEITFQVQLHESTNEIYYAYADVVFGGAQEEYDYGFSADIGLKGENNNVEVSSQSKTFLMNNECVRFFPVQCPSPQGFKTVYQGTDSLIITWNEPIDTIAEWNVTYGPEGFDPMLSGTTVNATNDTLFIGGLLSSTPYDFYINSACFYGGTSETLFGQAVTKSTCSTPTNFYANYSEDSVFLAWNWTESSGIDAYPSTAFNVQYGWDGFEFGTGTNLTLDNNYTDTIVDVMTGGNTYHIYLQAICGSDTSDYAGPWFIIMQGPAQNDSVCNAMPLNVDGSLYEFNNYSATIESYEYLVAPPATGLSTTTGWGDSQLNRTMWYTFEAPTSGNVFISARDNWYDGQVAVYEVGDCSDFSTFTLIGANDNSILNENGYPEFSLCGLTPGQTYYLLHDANGTYPGTFSLRLSEVDVNPGVASPTIELCEGESLNLSLTIDGEDYGGNWVNTLTQETINPIYTVPTPAINQTIIFEYNVSLHCSMESTQQEVITYAAPQAGTSGMIDACLNQPINLYSGLSGTVDLSGVWYASSGTPLQNSDVFAETTVGSVDYSYVVSNGVCPNDTSTVTVNSDETCDYLSITEEKLSSIKTYPNPTDEILNVSIGDIKTSKILIRSIRGELILIIDKDIQPLNTIDMSLHPSGVYLVELETEFGLAVTRVIKK